MGCRSYSDASAGSEEGGRHADDHKHGRDHDASDHELLEHSTDPQEPDGRIGCEVTQQRGSEQDASQHAEERGTQREGEDERGGDEQREDLGGEQYGGWRISTRLGYFARER
ncbi:hypothetical protein [Microbacterium rhizomatis]|uniref:Uncharacterized protein n=1 Tax=Microbacterium rhizomatis TaxID=1631477 RepID=A0A5J5IZX2_9MICO|nr:hypothetical protein [Microbacterium rhizomatis]KAA9105958.1 hypothetical protein F6B43_16490 [Microbacterium rhizomatis]